MSKRFLIYFIGNIDHKFVKIGLCQTNLYMRYTGMQVNCPYPLELLGIILCNDEDELRSLESNLHSLFKVFAMQGEWFKLAPEVDNYIQEFTESGQDILKEDREKRNGKEREYKNRPEVRERKRETDRIYRKNNREKRNEYNRRWRKNNPNYQRQWRGTK